MNLENRDMNPGSEKVTHKKMEMRSNTKGVPEVPTSKTPELGKDKSMVNKGDISKDGNVKM